MDSRFIELDALIERFKNFLSKLENRAIELEAETVEAGQQINDLDEIRFIHFKAGITGQYETLKVKAAEIFKEQLYKKSFAYHYSREDVRSDDYMSAYDAKIDATEKLLEDFNDKIDSILNSIFNKVKVKSGEEKLNEILDEYSITKENFCCTQCGSKLTINEVYFVSAYVTCEYCQTQNTFVPSTKMSLLPDLVRQIATEKTGELDYPIQGKTIYEKFLKIEKHARNQFFIKRGLIPKLVDSYKEVYKREISDFLMSFESDVNQEKDFHSSIIRRFGTEFIQQSPISTESTTQNNLEYESLLNKELLSMDFMKETVQKTTILTELEQYYQSIKTN